MRRSPEARRKSELGKIHLAKKQLGMDDDTYRAMLHQVGGVDSAAALDAAGRAKVLDHLRRLGFRGHHRRPTPAADKAALVSKVKAFLAEAKRPDGYADAMAQRMFQVDRYEWCDEQQMGKLVAALWYDAKRKGRPTR